MKSLVNTAVRQYLKFKKPRVRDLRYEAVKLQSVILQQIIKQGSQTVYGKNHHLNKLRSQKDFQSAVPVNSYEDLEPLIKRTMMGEQNLISSEKINWFAKSSGTTNSKSKYIPVSKKYLFNNHIQGNWDAVSFIYEQIPGAEIFSRKNLLMGGTIEAYSHNPNVMVGDITGIMIKHIPAIGRPFYTPDFDTALMKNWDEKIEKMAKIVSAEDVHLVAGVPTWSIVLFNKILEVTGKSNILDVWPNAIAYVHGGVHFGPYKAQFKNYFPSESFKYLEGYNASEGYIALQDDFNRDDMLLLCGNENYFEFIELEGYQKGKTNCISLEDVELGKVYVLIMSNASGLWRYTIGDTVRFTSLSPYRIQVAGRTKQFINAFGEELMVHNVESALSKVCTKLDIVINDYTIAPYYMDGLSKGRHDWFVEYIKPPNDPIVFSNLLDQELQNVNSDYEAKRFKDLALSKLCIHELPQGTFEKWYRKKDKFGSQNKVPRLSNDRQIIEELLELERPVRFY